MKTSNGTQAEGKHFIYLYQQVQSICSWAPCTHTTANLMITCIFILSEKHTQAKMNTHTHILHCVGPIRGCLTLSHKHNREEGDRTPPSSQTHDIYSVIRAVKTSVFPTLQSSAGDGVGDKEREEGSVCVRGETGAKLSPEW